jgi:acyl-CoA reductase-like NAD-dependent aldehyde dehydrogenase
MSEMSVKEAMGIARYLAEHAPPVGNGSIADRQTQVATVLGAEVERLRARDAAATAAAQMWREDDGDERANLRHTWHALSDALDELARAHGEASDG